MIFASLKRDKPKSLSLTLWCFFGFFLIERPNNGCYTPHPFVAWLTSWLTSWSPTLTFSSRPLTLRGRNLPPVPCACRRRPCQWVALQGPIVLWLPDICVGRHSCVEVGCRCLLHFLLLSRPCFFPFHFRTTQTRLSNPLWFAHPKFSGTVYTKFTKQIWGYKKLTGRTQIWALRSIVTPFRNEDCLQLRPRFSLRSSITNENLKLCAIIIIIVIQISETAQ